MPALETTLGIYHGKSGRRPAYGLQEKAQRRFYLVLVHSRMTPQPLNPAPYRAGASVADL